MNLAVFCCAAMAGSGFLAVAALAMLGMVKRAAANVAAARSVALRMCIPSLLNVPGLPRYGGMMHKKLLVGNSFGADLNNARLAC
jgi:hypothetical protein